MNASQPDPSDKFGSANELEPFTDDSGDGEDRMLDLLLAEAIDDSSDRPEPPDQTRVILERFHAAKLAPSSTKSPQSKTKSSTTPKPSPWGWLLAVSVAVMLMGSIAWQFRSQISVATLPKPLETAENDKPGLPGVRAANPDTPRPNNVDPEFPATDSKQQPGKPKPRRVIELAGPAGQNRGTTEQNALKDSATGDHPHAKPDAAKPDAAKPGTPEPQSVRLVSKTMENHLDRYWKRIGVKPTPLLDKTEAAERLRLRFGLNVSASESSDPDRLATALTRVDNRKAIASRLLKTWFPRFQSSKNPMVASVTDQLEQTLQQRSGMDRLVASWFGSSLRQSDSDPASGNMIDRMSGSSDLHQSLVRTVSMTHNRDLRCGRCHDTTSMGSAVAGQDEYWQFAASFLPVLQPSKQPPKNVFYDTTDGRRRLASPSEKLKPTPENLVGSEHLASGLVDWVWRAVHDRPLVSSPYDLSGAANSEMQRLHQELSQDLLASNFDLLRTIALVMSQSILGREVPNAMTPEGLLVARNEDWIEAVIAIDSFAASAPIRRGSTPRERARLVAKMDLPRLDKRTGRGAILAQPIGSDQPRSQSMMKNRPLLDRQSASGEVSEAALAGFPMRSTLMMPAWLEQLPTFESRRQHIAHLAGQLELEPAVADLAKQMSDAQIDETLILERIWWVIRPTGI